MSSFWDVLLRLENEKSSTKKTKKPDTDVNLDKDIDEEKPAKTLKQLDKTIFANLLRILKHSVIRDNRSLIDKMLSLLGK